MSCIDKPSVQRRCNQGGGPERILMHRPRCHIPPCFHMSSPAFSSLLSDVPFPFCLPQSHFPFVFLSPICLPQSCVATSHFPIECHFPHLLHLYTTIVVALYPPRLSLLVANRRAFPPLLYPAIHRLHSLSGFFIYPPVLRSLASSRVKFHMPVSSSPL